MIRYGYFVSVIINSYNFSVFVSIMQIITQITVATTEVVYDFSIINQCVVIIKILFLKHPFYADIPLEDWTFQNIIFDDKWFPEVNFCQFFLPNSHPFLHDFLCNFCGFLIANSRIKRNNIERFYNYMATIN